jgi:ABC-type phosphate transport system permease subunit
MIGVVLVFYYGISPMINSNGASFMTTENEDENEKKKAKKYNCLSRLGLILIFIGFIFQLLSNFTKN